MARLASASDERRLYTAALLLFSLCAGWTAWMAIDMGGGMPMPGGWQMSMAWMPMDGQGWLATATMFVGMWLAMMVAMMLPSALPMLLLYRRLQRFRGAAAAERDTALVAAGYFVVWTGFGVVAFCAGVAITQAAMQSRSLSQAVPLLTALGLLLAGLWQFTPWKSACLAHCRDPLPDISRARGGALGAWRLGLSHGAFCAGCCWGIMLVQLGLGVMNLALMIALAGWIALEKLTRFGPQLQRLGGGAMVLLGLGLGLRHSGLV